MMVPGINYNCTIYLRLDHVRADISEPSDCYDNIKAQTQPGDFQSDAQFFVFTGVVAWLGATVCLIIYVFFSQKYLDDDKKAPMIVRGIIFLHR